MDVITIADKLIVDNWHYVSPRILETIQLIEDRGYGSDNVFDECPDIGAGKKPGSQSSDEVIVYIALGIWGEYAAILPEVYRRTVSLDLGQRLSC